MSKLFIIFSIVFYSTLSFGNISLSKIKWKSLSENQRAAVVRVLREHVVLLEGLSAPQTGRINWKIIDEAYAAEYSCFVAGWPSVKKSNGNCEDPKIGNTSYSYHLGCPEKQVLCNPTLFGSNLCIKFGSKEEKNSAYIQCEQEFAKQGRLISSVADEVNEHEFQDLARTVEAICSTQKNAEVLCHKIEKRLGHFLDDDSLQNDTSKISIKDLKDEDLLDKTTKLQNEQESFVLEFQKECKDPITENAQLCKNLALKGQKANNQLQKLIAELEERAPADCQNCSTPKLNAEIQSAASLPEISKISCSEEDKKTNSNNCQSEIMCSIGSTALTAFLAVKDFAGKTQDKCMSSQNSCVTNLVTALVDSTISLVTGIWDLIGMTANFAKEGIVNFWNTITKVEDKTADAQLALSKMSDKDITEVKTNPLQWIKNFAGNVWKGLGLWMKEDIFCEEWSGVPRASQCVRPMKNLECASCRTLIAGTCSVGGVILTELVPAIVTGGAINIVARSANGAEEVLKFIRASKSYQKTSDVVSELAQVKAIKVATNTLKLPVTLTRPAANAAFNGIVQSYKRFSNSSTFKSTAKAMNKAATYTGLSALNQLNEMAFHFGYKWVDKVAMKGVQRNDPATLVTLLNASRTLDTSDRFEPPLLPSEVPSDLIDKKITIAHKMSEKGQRDLTPVLDDVKIGYEKGREIRNLQYDIHALKTGPNPDPQKISELEFKIASIKRDITVINDRYIDSMQKLYTESGIPAIVIKSNNGNVLELDFKVPVKNKPHELYRQVQKRFGLQNVTLSLKENVEFGALGFFSPSKGRMEIGPNQAVSMLDNYINSTGRHESRHAMFYAMRNFASENRGKGSIFHTSFHKSQDGVFLNDFKTYDSYMSSEELYTFSTDLQTYAKIWKGERLTDANLRSSLLDQIKSKGDMLTKVAQTNKNMSEEMILSIKQLIEEKRAPQITKNSNNTYSLSFYDRSKRRCDLTLVSEEEKALLVNALKVEDKINVELNAYIEKAAAAKFSNFDDLIKRASSNNLTPEEKNYIYGKIQEFNQSDRMRELEIEFAANLQPALEHSAERLKKLSTLADIQIAENAKLTELLSKHTDGNMDEIQKIREQMFHMGRNVKEDYKGFPLNQL